MPARWTDEEIDLLKQMQADGVSADKIAEKLGRSPSAIKTKLKSNTAKQVPKSKVSVQPKIIESTPQEVENTAQPASLPESENETSMIPYIIGAIVLGAIIWSLN